MFLVSTLLYAVLAWASQGANGATCSTGQTVAHGACCALFPVLADLQEFAFERPSCSSGGSQIIHLAFHDAMGFSLQTPGGGGGGADGSILTFDTIETTYAFNVDLEHSISGLKPLAAKHPISDGDFLHFAAAVAISSCPGAPRMSFSMGRPPAAAPANPTIGAPKFTDNVTTILSRFADVGFSPPQLVALLGAHSIAGTHSIDLGAFGAPLDSTPNLFDTQFYVDVMLPGLLYPGNGSNPGESMSPVTGEIRTQADFLISRDPRTACSWLDMILNPALAQEAFELAMFRLSTVGMNTSLLTDCSDVIPVPPPLPNDMVVPHILAGFNADTLEINCPTTLMPTLPIATNSSPVPVQHCTGTSWPCWPAKPMFTNPVIPVFVGLLETDLRKIFFLFTALDNTVKGFRTDGETLVDAVALNTDISNVLAAIDDAISHGSSITLPLALVDAQTLLTELQASVSPFVKVMQGLVKAKASFTALAFGPVIMQDLTTLNSVLAMAFNAILVAAPTSLQGQVQTLITTVNGALASAISAFST